MIFTTYFPPLFSQKRRNEYGKPLRRMLRTDDTKPVGAMAVRWDDPNWDYQAGGPGPAAGNHMVAYLIMGLQKAGHKAVNSDKLREITTRWKPSTISNQVNEELQKYTKLDPTSAEGIIVLNTHFIPQSSPDIQKKLKKAEEGPQTPNETF